MTANTITARHRRRRAFSLATVALLALALLTGGVTNAYAAGSISGQVMGQPLVGPAVALANVGLDFYDLNSNGDGPTASTTTDGSGNYSVNLPAGTYAAITQDIHGYINKIYSNIPCSAVCDVNSLTPIIVTNGAITGIDFLLTPGSRISGRVTSASSGLGIPGVTVYFTNVDEEVEFTKAVTDSNGDYTSLGGSGNGNVYAFTSNLLGYQDEVYNNVHCLDCDPATSGTAIAITLGVDKTGINFVLDPGGKITGNVSLLHTPTNTPLANVSVHIANSSGFDIGSIQTDSNGDYATLTGLPLGSYRVYTVNVLGLVDQTYNGVVCVGGRCDHTTSGSAITIAAPTDVKSGINFVLSPGATIGGTITNAAGGAGIPDVFVGIFNNTGVFLGGANANGLGAYSVAVPAGTFYAAALYNPDWANQLYNGIPCAGNCNITSGTAITVTTGATAGNVNFSLVAGGSISGTVTNGGTGVSGVAVQVFNAAGTLQGVVFTDGSGNYTFGTVAVGQYYVRTNGAGNNLVNLLYPGVTCVNCTVTTSGGTLVPVTAGNTTPNINFALVLGGRITGNVTSVTPSAPIGGMAVQLFNAAGVQMGSYSTAGSGVYTTFAMPAGNYFIRTAASGGQNFIDKAWPNLVCVPCTVTTSTPIAVTVAASVGAVPTVSGKDFALATGGSFGGTVTDAGTGLPIPSMSVFAYDATGILLKTTTTDGAGGYALGGLPTGNFFARTSPNGATQNYVTQEYNAIVYDSAPTLGTPIAVTAGGTHPGVNFSLSSGGALSGTVTDESANPLPSVQLIVYASTGRPVKFVNADGVGNYTVTGLQAGNYFVSTNVGNAQNFADEFWDNKPCAGCVTIGNSALPIVTLPCTSCITPASAGNAVSVTNGGNHTGVNFALAPGAGAIMGIVTDAITGVGLPNVEVDIYNGAGNIVKRVTSLINTGIFSARGLPPGTYYGRTVVSQASPFFTDQAFGGAACVPCDVPATSSAIVVTANTTTNNVNFALSAGGAVTGSVTDAVVTANKLSAVNVQLFGSTGTLLKTTYSGSTGSFEFDGLPAGSYRARTVVPVNLSFYTNELYDNVPCTSCDVTTGTAIAVTLGATHTGVNFALQAPLPTVSTSAATTLTPFGATLNGSVNPSGSATTALFQYGTTTGYGSVAVVTAPGSGIASVPISGIISGLSCNTLYHFRAQATNVGGTVNGGDLTFTTSACPAPTVVTGAATGVTQTSATLNGTVNPNGTSTTASFEYGITTAYGSVAPASPVLGSGFAALAQSLGINGLICDTIYHFRIKATNVGGTTSGSDATFTTTGVCPPAIAPISNAITRGNTAIDISITLSGGVNGPAALTVTASSSNEALVPNGNLIVSQSSASLEPGAAGASRTLRITPAAGAKGSVTITVTATDTNSATVSRSFVLLIGRSQFGDFDGDGKTEIGVFRPSTGTWFIRYTGTPTAFDIVWGGGSDKIVPGDYDGDGKTDIAVFRPSTGTWFIRYTQTPTAFDIVWGGGGDIPVPADYDGDGKTDIAVFRPSTGTWFIRYTQTPTAFDIVWGGTGDIPVPADYDGDGKTDIAVFRPSTGTWFIRYTQTPTAFDIVWGGSGDEASPADYDGDGKTDIAVFRPSTGTWFIRYTQTPTAFDIVWGGGTDIPVAGDFDGDGKTDIAVFRPATGTWFIRYTGTPTAFDIVWGGGSDIPTRKRQ